MKDKFEKSYSPEVVEKTKKNLVWVTVFSITMLFAGFTSAYIVSMGDSFWIKIDLPDAFYISTVLIVVSSITLWLGLKSAKAKKTGSTRIYILTTLFLGILFAIFQFMGYQKLVERGAHWVSRIIVSDGRYGDYYEIKKDGAFLEVINNQYAYKGEVLKGEELDDLQSFAGQFLTKERNNLDGIEYGDYILYYKGEPVSLVNGQFFLPNGDPIELLDYERLVFLARNIVDNRADFFMKGEMGKDFKLLYNGKELDYKNRKLYLNGQELPTNYQNKLLRGNKDTSTAYFYIITVLHLLHVLAGVIWLLIMTKRSFTGEIVEKNAMSLKAGSIFWHFLGVLWIYLLLFLVFIH
ncbi:MAG: cytochrome c oxidase subunit 3 [Brumimicrobium sp.]|nr:cytochrome c oxidase subunit 3 [Brumimicrobium sp.]